MAKLYRVSIDLAQNELLNPRAQNLASAPGSPVSGQFWFNSATGRLEFRGVTGAGTGATPAAGAAGTIDPTSRAFHYGQQTADTISDFATAARSAIGGANLVMGGNRITGLPSAIANDEPATYGQLLSVQNGIDWKQSVRAASTGNLTLSNTQTVDGVALVAGDRVLVKDQSSAAANGIYTVVSGGAWTRATDGVQGQLTSGATVAVTEGTANGNQQWQLITDDPITVGTTAQQWTQIGAGTSYTFPALGGILNSSNQLTVDTSIFVRKYAVAVGGATSIPVTHNLNTRDVTVGVYDAATYDEIECDVTRTSVNVVTLGFAVAPAAAAFRCVVHG